MLLYDFLNLPQVFRIQPMMHGQRYDGFQPEFSLAVLAGDMNMDSVLFI